MNKHIRGFRQLILSRTAREQEYGVRLAEAFNRAGLPVHECADDAEATQHPEASRPSTLVVLFAPPSGWISQAEHGTLSTRVGEHYLHPIVGCRSACSYCYLQVLPQGRRPLQLYVGFDDLVQTLDEYLKDVDPAQELLFCTGELADSLADVDLYPVAPALIEDFARRSGARLELRTKSDNVEPLLGLDHRRKTAVAFSVAPQQHVMKYEPGTASLEARLRAARLCQESGYPVALKFEPLTLTPDWKPLYEDTLRFVASCVDVGTIHHISVGCLRWSEALAALPVFVKHYRLMLQSSTWIEYRPGKFNGTSEWHDRLSAYQWMRHLLRRHDITAPIWWSMETPEMIDALESHKE